MPEPDAAAMDRPRQLQQMPWCPPLTRPPAEGLLKYPIFQRRLDNGWIRYDFHEDDERRIRSQKWAVRSTRRTPSDLHQGGRPCWNNLPRCEAVRPEEACYFLVHDGNPQATPVSRISQHLSESQACQDRVGSVHGTSNRSCESTPTLYIGRTYTIRIHQV